MIASTLTSFTVSISPALVQQECFGTISNADFMDLWRFTMADSKDILISALVLLRSAGGKEIDSSEAISANNLAEFAPSPTIVASASEIFRARGFEVGPMVGVSFSVTGRLRTFEEFLGMQIQLGKDGAYEFVSKNKTIGHELSSAELPEELHKFVAVVAFPLPFEFFP
jgi:hypothetical protein